MGEEGLERSAKKPRVMVDAASLAILRASYLSHFSEYSKSKKQVSQRLPGKVWKSVYQDFLSEMEKIALQKSVDFVPEALPSMRTLQDALRSSISINTSAAKFYEKASVQHDDFPRDSTANDTLALSDVNNLIAAEIGERLESASLSSTSDRTTSSHRTEGRLESMVHTQCPGAGLETMLAAIPVAEVGKAAVDIMKAHVLFLSQKLKLLGADLVLKGEAHAADMRMKQLQLLILLRDEGVITSEEFRLKAKAVAEV